MEYFIKNYISAFMLFLGMIIFGLIGLNRLTVSLMPPSSYPAISVIIEYPGIAPEKIETIITKPVEKIIKTVSGIEKVNSVSEEGKSRINISFEIDSNIKISALKVREKIGLIRPYFPDEVQEPVVVRYDPSDRPVIIATAESKGKTPEEIREIVERKIKPKLQRIEGVSEINIAGGLQKEIHINIDSGRLFARDISFRDISPIIQNSNISLPGGIINSNNRDYIVYTSCRYRNLDEISGTVIMKASQGSLINVRDIATVKNSFRDREDIARFNGKERVTIYLHKAGDANTLDVCNKAADLLVKSGYADVTMVYNQGEYIKASINNVISSGTWGMAVVILVLSLFVKRPGTSFAIGLSMPVTLIIVFAFMYFFHISINIMSLSGLALGAGMIVDNGIVIADSVYSRKIIDDTGIIESVSSVKNAIISSTLTTIIVFFPIVFGNAEAKRTYSDLAFTVSSALLISLVTAIILIPSLFSAFEKYRGHEFIFNSPHLIKKTMDLFKGLQRRAEDFEEYLLGKYRNFLEFSFCNTGKVLSGVIVLAFLSMVFYTLIKKEYVDPSGRKEFYVYLEFPTGTSLNYTNKAVEDAENYIRSLNVSEKLTVKVEKWRGTLSIELKDEFSSIDDQLEIKEKIKSKVNGLLKKYNGFVFITEADEVSAKELNIVFIGNENKTLQKLAKKAAGQIAAIPSVTDCVLRFREGRPEYGIYIERDKASLSMLTPAILTDFFRSAVFGPVVTKYIDDDREVDVRMRFKRDQRDSIKKILNYKIKNLGGSVVPVKEVVKIKEEIGPTKIWRQNGRRSVTITAKIGTLTYEEAARHISRVLEKLKFPPEYTYEFGENLKKIQKNRKGMMIAIGLAIVLVYMVLASLFESIKLPFVIMTTVPLALIGVIFTLFITSSSINISVYIGLIVLAGIVVNNGIILVNSINNGLHKKSMRSGDLIPFIKGVCYKRFRPVLITTLTTTLGLLPMLIKSGEGSNLWRPLSLTVISGLMFSTLLTLIVVPVLCYLLFKNNFRSEQ